jgi:hypothetical protein
MGGLASWSITPYSVNQCIKRIHPIQPRGHFFFNFDEEPYPSICDHSGLIDTLVTVHYTLPGNRGQHYVLGSKGSPLLPRAERNAPDSNAFIYT